jgi:hypothetical protein
MNLIAYLEMAKTPTAKKIIEAESFDLNRIKEQLKELEEHKVLGYVLIADFISMAGHFVFTEMTQKAKKARQMMIGDKYFQAFADVKTEFLDLDQVSDRITKWANNWEKIKAKHHFYPTAIIRIEKGFLWCTKDNLHVPKEFVVEIEAAINENRF